MTNRDSRAIQRDQANKLLNKFEKSVLAVVEKIFRKIARQFSTDLNAAAEPIDEAAFNAMRDVWNAGIESITIVLSRIFQASSDTIRRRFGVEDLTLLRAIVDEYVRTSTNRLTAVGDELWFAAREELADGIRAGEGYQDLRRRLIKVFSTSEVGTQLSDSRAERIARTEAVGAWNQGSLASARLISGEDRPLYKTWLATVDTRTRNCHWEVDGTTIPIDGKFSVCGVEMDSPHDPLAPADQVINCRCTVTFGDDPEAPSDEGRQFLSDEEIRNVEDFFEDKGIERKAASGVTMGSSLTIPKPSIFDRKRKTYSRPIHIPYSQLKADATAEPELIIHSARIRGATLVDIPAFTEVSVELRGEPDEQGLVPVGGIIAAENVATGDGRMQSLESLRWEGESWPLRWDREDTGFHEGAILVGRIDRLERVGNLIEWDGVIDLNIDEGNQVAGIIHRGMPVGISIDMDDIPPEEVEFKEPEELIEGDVEVVTKNEVVAAVVGDTDLPIHPDREYEWDGSGAASRVLDWATGDEDSADPDRLAQAFLWRDDGVDPATLSAYKLGFADVFDGELHIVARGVFAVAGALEGAREEPDIPEEDQERLRGVVSGLYERLAEAFDDDTIRAPWDPADEDDILMDIEASAWAEFQDMPKMPSGWFKEPTPEELPTDYGPIHYADGRIFGWVAQAGVCHNGFSDECLTLDDLGDIDLTTFNRRAIELDDGTKVAAGVFTMNTGHNNDGADVHSLKAMFDNTRTVAGIVTVGRNNRGIWFSGAAAPWLSEWDRQVFASCAPSYHVRREVNGRYSLLAVLSVPVPGHPTKLNPNRLAASSYLSRNHQALVASVVKRSNSVLDPLSGETAVTLEAMEFDYSKLASLVVDEIENRKRLTEEVSQMMTQVASAKSDLVKYYTKRMGQ